MDNSHHTLDFKEGEVLLVNKPLNWTSFDVVNKLRYAIKRSRGFKKIKVGHAGTLDPLADGLLIICTGKKTKAIEQYMGLPKTYSGTITLGGTTPSFDLETEIDQKFPVDHITNDMLLNAAEELTGEYDQYPPVFSAKKIQGNKAYEFARQGIEVELKPKRIHVEQFKITDISTPDIKFRITCSKGTYIRSIANDFGKLLESGAHLSSLRREDIGEFCLKNAHSVDEWMDIIWHGHR